MPSKGLAFKKSNKKDRNSGLFYWILFVGDL